ncbi:hypothetical protein C8P68_1167, partial [Mucilaginibacter yixingensis]
KDDYLCSPNGGKAKLKNGAKNAERGEKKNKNFLLANKKKVLTFAIPNKTGQKH